MSFLDLPGEIRNQIYHLVISPWMDQYVELHQLHSRGPKALLPILLMQTCRQLQKEVTSLFFRNITLSLRIHDKKSLLRHESRLFPSLSSTMCWYSCLDSAIADQFHSLSIEVDSLFCKMLVTHSKSVFVHISTFVPRRYYCTPWFFTSGILTKVSIAIRNSIIRSLATSPTGLLGYQHLATAEGELKSLLEWHEWKTQQFRWQLKKDSEALWHINKHPTNCSAPKCYVCYLITQAEKEGLPRLIPAVSVEDARQTLQRFSWFRDEKLWHIKKSIEADRTMSSQQWWYHDEQLVEAPLIEEAEQEKMPRLIRAATSPLDELEMYG